MGVSKIAVMALVVIVAAPIILGFALNLNETTITDYNTTGESVNVTPLLQNSIAYTTAIGDAYQLNSDISISSMSQILPIYKTITTAKTPLPAFQSSYFMWSGGMLVFDNISQYYMSFDYTDSPTTYVTAQIYSEGTLLRTIDHVNSFFYDRESDAIQYWYENHVNTAVNGNYTAVAISLTGMASVGTIYSQVDTLESTYADLADGYYLNKMNYMGTFQWEIDLPSKTTSALLSFDLNSITASSYTIKINNYLDMTKTTTNGVVAWTMTYSQWGSPTETYNMYYDPNISDNTYQILITHLDQKEPTATPGTYTYYRHIECRYIGHWQKSIGESNYYKKFTFDGQFVSGSDNDMNNITLKVSLADQRTPIMRVDSAVFKAFEYDVIENNMYYPSSFKTNPATTIKNIGLYGTSLIFGGSTFNVSDGCITLDSHKLPIEKLVFKSVPNGSGGYDNMIGNTLISTTAEPSTISFMGKWSANVETKELTSVTITETEWDAGKFAWDGIDINFLLVGIMAAFGCMVGLGIYAKNRRMTVIPLVIVCGCAGMLFFLMI